MASKTWVLTDLEEDVYVERLALGRGDLAGAAEGCTVTKRTLQGGLRSGVDVVEVNNGAFRFVVVPTRGMGISRASLGPVQLGWRSPLRGSRRGPLGGRRPRPAGSFACRPAEADRPPPKLQARRRTGAVGGRPRRFGPARPPGGAGALSGRSAGASGSRATSAGSLDACSARRPASESAGPPGPPRGGTAAGRRPEGSRAVAGPRPATARRASRARPWWRARPLATASLSVRRPKGRGVKPGPREAAGPVRPHVEGPAPEWPPVQRTLT
ncbi:MAG: DUF4432 family protein [Thermoguttaceae bacterium]